MKTCAICGDEILTEHSVYTIEEGVLFAHSECWFQPMKYYTDSQESYDREKAKGL